MERGAELSCSGGRNESSREAAGELRRLPGSETHSAAGEANLRELQGTGVPTRSSQFGNARERGLVAHAIMRSASAAGVGGQREDG